jgi:hypothetical protein
LRLMTTTTKQYLGHYRVRMAYLIHIKITNPRNPAVNQEIDIYMTSLAQTIEFPVPGYAPDIEWLGGGRMLDIQFAQEDSSLEIHNAEVTLDGLDVALISLVLNENLERAKVWIYLALFEPDTNQPLEPATLFMRGTMSNVRILPATVMGGTSSEGA